MKNLRWLVLSLLFSIVVTVTLTALAAAQSAPAALDIAQSPLYLKSKVKPAFIMAVDDSGSMNWEILAANQDGELIWGRDDDSSTYGFFEDDGDLRDGNDDDGDENASDQGDFLELFPFPGRGTKREAVPPIPNFGFARSPEYNPAYYNPASQYEPWKNHDGSSWESIDKTAEWKSVKVDPRSGTTVAGAWNDTTFDLTSTIKKKGDAWKFDVEYGMQLPRSVNYHRSADCDDYDNEDEWSGQPRDYDVTIDSNGCEIAIEYFPATYYLTTPTSPDGSSGELVTFTEGGPRSGSLYRYEIKPSSYQGDRNGDGLNDYKAAMTNFANWFTYYRSRNLAMVAAMTNSFDSVDFMRVGYFTINNPDGGGYDSYDDVTMYDMAELDPDLPAAYHRDELYEQMTELPADGNTPNRWAVQQLGTQFTRADDGAPVQIACQVNAGMLFTDGYSNEGFADDVGEHDSGVASMFGSAKKGTMADTAAKYYLMNLRGDSDAWTDKFNFSEIKEAACDANPADQSLDCRNDPHMNFYGITLGALGARYGQGAYVDLPGTDVDEARVAAIANTPDWLPPQDNSITAVDEIWHATLNGRGAFVNASSPAAITEAMEDILGALAADAGLSGTQSVAGARLGAGSFNVVPGFAYADGGHDWVGTLTAYGIEPSTGSNVAPELWTAHEVLPAPSARNIWTATGPVDSSSSPVVEFKGGNLTAAQIGADTGAVADLDASVTEIVDYLRGDQSLEAADGLRPRTLQPMIGTGTARHQSSEVSLLGDIVNSAPRLATAQDNYGWADARGLSDAARQAYADFVDDNRATCTGTGTASDPLVCPSSVFVGANDGMLHAFDGSDGVESFAYIPNGVLDEVGKLADPGYTHRYYVDGGIALSHVYDGSGYQSILVGSTGAGGRSVFGLNIGDPESFDASDVLWEINSDTDVYGADLGYVLGTPVIVPLDDGSWVALFGNGYNSANGDPVLFVVDVLTGQVITTVKPDDGNDVDANGLGNLAAIDTDGDGLVDTVYGGDLLGNMWKFQVDDGGTWSLPYGSGTPLFVATDPVNGERQPITGGIEVSAGPGNGLSVFFGTGRYFVEGDNTPGSEPQVQSLYSIWDNGTAVSGGRGDLQVQTPSAGAVPNTRVSTGNTVDYAADERGWVLDLELGTGEMSIGMPRLQNGKVFFVTFQPLQSVCDPAGTNWLYGLDALTGRPALSQLSLDPSGEPPVCVGDDCAAIAIADGAPVRGTNVLVPPVGTDLAGSGGPPACDPATEDCFAKSYQRCTLIIRAAGAAPMYLPRPCGRQSWRQIR